MPRKGDTVTIYHRPLSEEAPEGRAELIYLQESDGGVYDGRVVQRWLVRFEDDLRQYSREVLTDIPYVGT